MIDKHYRESALTVYGSACEICGHRTSLEVHHIDYQEHQEMENKLRKEPLPQFINEAIGKGYSEWNPITKQLSKNDDTENTSVLCGNCHSFLHTVDYGKLLLNVIHPRLKGGNLK